MKTREYAISCGVLLIEEQPPYKVLVVEQRKRGELPRGVIGIPKGAYDSKCDRNLPECARRECYEETGLMLDMPETPTIMIKNKRQGRVLYVFCIMISKIPAQLRACDEIERHHIIPIDQLHALCDKKRVPHAMVTLFSILSSLYHCVVS